MLPEAQALGAKEGQAALMDLMALGVNHLEGGQNQDLNIQRFGILAFGL